MVVHCGCWPSSQWSWTVFCGKGPASNLHFSTFPRCLRGYRSGQVLLHQSHRTTSWWTLFYTVGTEAWSCWSRKGPSLNSPTQRPTGSSQAIGVQAPCDHSWDDAVRPVAFIWVLPNSDLGDVGLKRTCSNNKFCVHIQLPYRISRATHTHNWICLFPSQVGWAFRSRGDKFLLMSMWLQQQWWLWCS